jgi:multiple sugar transport system ATP-binding protein
VVAKMAGHDVVAIFRERYDFQPGQKVKLKPQANVVHLFDKATGKRL